MTCKGKISDENKFKKSLAAVKVVIKRLSLKKKKKSKKVFVVLDKKNEKVRKGYRNIFSPAFVDMISVVSYWGSQFHSLTSVPIEYTQQN